MKMKPFAESCSRALNRIGLKLMKASPTILLVGGAVGLAGAGVVACVKTLEVNDILDDTKAQLDAVKEMPEGKERTVELAKTYGRAVSTLGRHYALPIAMGGMSIAAILYSHRQMTKRNAAVSAALMGVSNTLKDYRNTVKEKYGEDVDREIMYHVKKTSITDPVTGEAKTLELVDPEEIQGYSIVFDESNDFWDEQPGYNVQWLNMTQTRLNDKLRATGHLFLNEVYRAFGLEDTPRGQIAGWIYDPRNAVGDPFVSFGIFEASKARMLDDYEQGFDPEIVIELNCQPNILAYI